MTCVPSFLSPRFDFPGSFSPLASHTAWTVSHCYYLSFYSVPTQTLNSLNSILIKKDWTMSAKTEELSFSEVMNKAAKSAVRGGTAGAVAMGANVAALMWMRTTVSVLLARSFFCRRRRLSWDVVVSYTRNATDGNQHHLTSSSSPNS